MRSTLRVAAILFAVCAVLWQVGVTPQTLNVLTAATPAEAPRGFDATDDCSAGDVVGAPAEDRTPEDGSVTWRGAAYSTGPDPQPARPAAAARREVTVYVTRTGKKYHRGSCQYLSQSKIPMALSEARRVYDPCSVCDPPR